LAIGGKLLHYIIRCNGAKVLAYLEILNDKTEASHQNYDGIKRELKKSLEAGVKSLHGFATAISKKSQVAETSWFCPSQRARIFVPH
jgi:hypothetical protein